jgi:hypothetical protein
MRGDDEEKEERESAQVAAFLALAHVKNVKEPEPHATRASSCVATARA